MMQGFGIIDGPRNRITAGGGSVTVNADGSVSIAPATGTGVTVTSSAAAALAIGRLGATTPALQVDASAAASVTGIKVTAAAAGGGAALSLIGGNAAEALSIDSKGTGYLLLQTNATGNVGIGITTPTQLLTLKNSGALGWDNGAGTADILLYRPTANILDVAVTTTSPVLRVNQSAVNAVTGLQLSSQAAGNGFYSAVIGGNASESLFIDAKGAGTITLNGTATGSILINRNTTITSAAAAALAVGRLGSTTSAFQVDASAANSITGVKVTAAAAGGGIAVDAIGETNVALTLNSAGSGAVSINSTGTGVLNLGHSGGSIGLYAVAAVARATTAGVAGAFVANTSGIVNDTATWDLYTIGQVVRALRNIGILT